MAKNALPVPVRRLVGRMRHRAGVTASAAHADPAEAASSASRPKLPGGSSEDDGFIRFSKEYLDPDIYLLSNRDVANAGVDPLEHWLNFGFREGRAFGPNTAIHKDQSQPARTRGPKRHFTFRGEALTVAFRRVPQTIAQQIMQQARHEPAILAAGADAVPALRIFGAGDVFARSGVDCEAIFSAVGERPGVLLLLPRLVIGGAETYAANLVETLSRFGRGAVLLIVTEQTAAAARGWHEHACLAGLAPMKVVFWSELCGPGHTNPLVLANAVNALRPSVVLVVNSRIGLDMVAMFGRALSQRTQLVCAYFSMGVRGLGAPFGCRFPRLTTPFAISLTDNAPMAETLHRLHGDQAGPGIRLLPPRVAPAEQQIFQSRVAARRTRAAHPDRRHRWAWVSRVERMKGTDLLARIARLRPNDQFDVFGPVQQDIDLEELTGCNLAYRGVLDNVAIADFTPYDGFLFTSLCEGMPNVVLEMSQHGLPMALSDVGGLRATFAETAMFVAVQHEAAIASSHFAAALEGIATMGAAEAEAMASAARDRALQWHGPGAYDRAVSRIFGDGR